MYTWGFLVVESISSEAAGTAYAVLVGVGSFVSVFYILCLFYYLLREPLFFGGAVFSGWFIIFSALFILTYMERKFSGESSSRADF